MNNPTNTPEVDFYFLDSTVAHNTALLQKKSGLFNNLQVCYYDGQKIEGTPENMINVPLEKIYDFFSKSNLRPPQAMNCEKRNLEKNTISNLNQYIQKSLYNASLKRQEMAALYKKEIQNIKLDFTQPLRILFITTRITSVMQYASKNVSEALRKLGYETFVSIEENDMQIWGSDESDQFVWHLKNILEFKPHVIFNINYLHNEFLPKDMFNFIWFQDPMPILSSKGKLKLRERDFLFSGQPLFDEYLTKSGVSKTKFSRQYLGYNSDSMFIDKNIKKENKIIFVGSYYDIYERFDNIEIYNDDCSLFEEGIPLTKENIKNIYTKYNEKYTDINLNLVQQSVIRNKVVEWLCNSGLENIEIYGYKWDRASFSSIKKFYKGSVPHEKVKDLYNSAEYILMCSGQVINTQRLAECAACGSIPVVYDSRSVSPEEETWDDECLYFKSQNELKEILQQQKKPKGNISKIADFFSYTTCAKKILKRVEDGLKNENDDFITDYTDHLSSLLKNIDKQAINKIIETLDLTVKNKSKVYLLGHEESSATASHIFNNLGIKLKQKEIKNFNIISLTDNTPVYSAIQNDIGCENIFQMQLQGLLEKDDVIIAISWSGNTPSILNAVNYAKTIGTTVIGLTGFNGGELKLLSDIAYHTNTTSKECSFVEDMNMTLSHILYSYYINKGKNNE